MLIKSTFPAFSVSSLFLVKRKNVQLYRAFLVCYNRDTESQRAKAAYPPYGGANPPDERKEGLLMYVTYQDLIQIGIFVIALVGLCYAIFGTRK